MPQIKAVIFDMDGTLFDSELLSAEATNYGFTKILGRELSESENRQLIGRPVKKILAEWFPEKGGVIYETGREYYRDRMEKVRTYPGINELLSSLSKRRIRMALVTSSHRIDAETLLLLSGTSQFFEFYVGQEDTQYHKPDPEPLILAMKKLGLDTAACVYIGDQPYDIIAANAADVKSLGAVWGTGSRDLLEPHNPYAVAEQPSEVVGILDDISRTDTDIS